MQVIVKGRNTHVSNHLKELATQKLEKVQRFFDRINSLEVEFSEEHNPRIADKHVVEVTLTTKQHVLRAHASAPDAPTAIDRVEAKLETQVKRLKGKMVGRNHRAADKRDIENASNPVDRGEVSPLLGTRNGSGRPIESEYEELGEADGPAITRVKRFALKPMTAEEAVLQMESLGHDFFLFVDAESEQAGVVYRRRDGSFGLIEPQ